MKYILILVALSALINGTAVAKSPKSDELKFFSAADKKLQYVGRINFANKMLPRFWAPGVYIRAGFKGTYCEVLLNDQGGGKNHNYISIQIDNGPVKRIKLKNKVDTIKINEGLTDEKHLLTICKSTEANIGYLEFAGLRCKKLVRVPALPKRKIEYFGDSITTGTGSDASEIPCNTGEWYDEHNAYMSYGPITARLLNAQWHITAFAGIGLTKSCCNMKVVMSDVYDKVDLANNKIPWDFNLYQPDVVAICLGQNDGIRDSAVFCYAYVTLINTLRDHYPEATIICMASPMADDKLVKIQKLYLSSITRSVNNSGDRNVYHFFLSKRYHAGCGDHPDMAEHQLIANELGRFIKQTKKW